MKKTRLAVLLPLCLASAISAQAAQYKVVELGLADKGVNSFANTIDQTGKVYSQVDGLYNPPIDPALINFESDAIKSKLTDIESAKAGNYNLADLTYLNSLLIAGINNQNYQQLAQVRSYASLDGQVTQVTGLDTVNDAGNYTQSVNSKVNGVNSNGDIAGRSADSFYTVDYTNKDGKQITYVVNNNLRRGFVKTGEIRTALLPADTTFGGVSEAFDINSQLQVVGYASIESTDTLKTALETCNRDKDNTEKDSNDKPLPNRGDQPLEACLHKEMVKAGFANNFKRHAALWQLDATGVVTGYTDLGIAYTPASDDTFFYQSQALGLNENGVAVGYSQLRQNDNLRTHAAIFKDGAASLFVDQDEYNSSVANDINDNGLVVGQAFKVINGADRSKFYVHNSNDGTTRFPDDFFPGSASVAHAINNQGLVVGEGEIDSTISGARRREAFLYDIGKETFSNLNNLIACDSPYRLVQAVDINEQGEIAVTATTSQAKRNILGEEVKDDSGNTIMQEVAVSLRLEPIAGGTVDDCNASEDKFKRKAGSGSLLWLALLATPLFWRRKG